MPAGEAIYAPLPKSVKTGSTLGRGILHRDGKTTPKDWMIAEEVPVALSYNGGSTVVMMATPADLEDFAIGFTLSEDMLGDINDIQSIKIEPQPNGFEVKIDVDPRKLARRALRKRAIEGRSGCGLCGVESLADAMRMRHKISPAFEIDVEAIDRAFKALKAHQPMNRMNHSVHAAAWCLPDGTIIETREDVGRHNALDKLIGALLRAGRHPAEGFVVMSSRCSFELVQKCAISGIACLATISAPTSLALSMAAAAGMRLASLSPDGILLFDEEPPL